MLPNFIHHKINNCGYCLYSIQVYAEFQRITNQNLPNTFYAELDRHTPRLMALFRQKASNTGKTAEALADIFKVHDTQVIIHITG